MLIRPLALLLGIVTLGLLGAYLVAPASPRLRGPPVSSDWQTVDWYDFRIPIPPRARWQPELKITPPALIAPALAQAAVSYGPIKDTREPRDGMVFVIYPWGGSLEDWLKNERGDPPTVEARDTTVADLPAKVYQHVGTDTCKRSVYIALLRRDLLLYAATGCPDAMPYGRVIQGLQHIPRPTPTAPRPCPPPLAASAVDFANIMQFDGIEYHGVDDAGRVLTEADVGPEYARVRCKLQDHAYQPIEGLQDGDAALLDPGTPVYSVRGYRPSFRLAVRQQDRWVLFESHDNPQARRGADLLDLAGKVRSIAIHRSLPSSGPLLATIGDAQEVTALVAMIEGAHVEPIRWKREQDSYRLVFAFEDGTITRRLYQPGGRRLAGDIVLPPTFQTALDRALRNK